MKLVSGITEKHIYKLLKHDWHAPVRKSDAGSIALCDLGFTEMEVNWLLNTIEWKFQISIDAENIPVQTSVESFVKQVLSAPGYAA